VDPILNPFSPGAGSRPPELVGRDDILAQADVLLGRVRAGRAEKSLLLTGLRGVGKTVLLNEIEHRAAMSHDRTVVVEASEGTTLAALLAPHLRRLLFDLDRLAGAGHKVRRALAVLRSFVGGIRVEAGGLEFGLDIEPERGTADSGDLRIDLTDLFTAVGEAARERCTTAVLLIDELQYLDAAELGALIMAMHRVQQLRLPLVLVGAGLPVLPGLAGDARSYAERLFAFPNIGALSRDDAVKALVEPTREAGVVIEADALEEIYRHTKGYPYFLQEWGYQAWNTAEASPIRIQDVHHATARVTARLDANFFRVRFDRLTPGEKRCLRAMAELGPGPHRTGDVAHALGYRSSTTLSPVRKKLIDKGMVYSPSHGEMAFTVPLFDEFMRRVMPTLDAA